MAALGLEPEDDAFDHYMDVGARHADDAMALIAESVRQHEHATAPALREALAGTLLMKGLILGMLDRDEDAVLAYKDLIARFEGDETPRIREFIADAREELDDLLNGD